MKLVALTAIVAALAISTTASGATPTLVGVDGPGFTITLTKGGKKVTKLTHGTYVFKISDKSGIHNFTLEREKPSKPHMEKVVTATGFAGSKTLVWTLKPGSWRAYCSVHEALMHQDFKVTK